MPFDVADFPGASSEDRAANWRSRRLVGTWLLAIAAMLIVMIGLGGLTRLTGSGLSIMEWAPLLGALPPLSEAEWNRLFGLYQQIPQYTLLNADFVLADFKRIFWLEWIHRLWGRALGLAYIGPLAWFWLRGHVSHRLGLRLLGLFTLGALQGVVGWFMVSSGFFPDQIAVSAYRLVLHLGLALALYLGVVWTALSVLTRSPTEPARALHWLAFVTCALVVITALAGGFVAGLKAGLTFNTFPLMDGRLVPSGYGALSPFILNLTENVAAVQFNHRLLATLSLIMGTVTLAMALRTSVAIVPRWVPLSLGGLLIAQYALGVATLLHAVPVSLAVLHQVCAVALMTAALVLVHLTRGGRDRSAPPMG